MNRLIMIASVAGALALPMLAAPQSASASCADRKTTGTILGGVGGALIGNSIARGGGGAVVGGLGGAVLGHEIAASGCNRYRSRASYRYYRNDGRTEAARPARRIYYDQYGQPVSQGPVDDPQSGGGYAGTPDCRTENQSYYDDRGDLVQRQVQSCGR